MRIDSVDFFYLAMPEITMDADGSQDALLVRVQADGVVGWGECEASPLTSIAAFVTPPSHGACLGVADSVIGERLDGPDDIRRIAAAVTRNSMDLLQAPHTFSGIEIALWDLLGVARQEPVWRLLGQTLSLPKTPYASVLFGDDPQTTLERGRSLVARGFRAVKFGWGPFGTGTVEADADQIMAAREGIGPEAALLVDAGQIWDTDVAAAAQRLPALDDASVTWLEEPFHAHAISAYADLARYGARVGLAGGEGAHNVHMAMNLMSYGAIRFIQTDTGRIGGIGSARDVADAARARDIVYVNHTFTSHLALSASLQSFASDVDSTICEYPAEPRALALAITENHLDLDDNGQIAAPDAPGLGMSVDTAALGDYLRDVRIEVDGTEIFRSSPLPVSTTTGATT
jgi:L-alanine-DL-glutamate epimerase-like enolase superfamily enzyme